METIHPVVITTTNAKEAVLNYSKKHMIPTERVAFDIISYMTYFRLLPSKQWRRIDDLLRKKILQPKNLENPSLQFAEQYKLRLYKLEAVKRLQPLSQMQSTKLKTKIVIVIPANEEREYTPSFFKELTDDIQRKLLLSGFLLGIFASDIEKKLEPLKEELKVNKRIKENFSFVLSQGMDPSSNIPFKLISHFLLKGEDQRRAYESGVDEDELILEHIYPLLGHGGRDCRGGILPPLGDPIATCELIYFDPQTVRIVREDDRALYFSRKKGFVNFQDQKLLVSNELQLDLASFKTTGSITLGGDRDIDLLIHQADTSRDALERGVNINVSSVNIKGSIADHTSIKADQVTIDSYTHKNSTIEAAQNANVYLHRGNLKTHHATIGKLEFGLIEADTVHVKEVLGGEIRAREIHVDILHSNAKLIASDLIEIRKISGKNNTLVIAPEKIESLSNYITETADKIKTNQRTQQILQRDLDKLTKKIESEYGAIEIVQKEVAKAVRQGQELPVLAATKVRQYGIDRQKSEAYEKELQELTSEIESLQSSYEQHKEILYHAKIIYKDYWNGSQQIFYEHPDSKKVEKIIPEGFKREIVYNDLSSSELITISE